MQDGLLRPHISRSWEPMPMGDCEKVATKRVGGRSGQEAAAAAAAAGKRLLHGDSRSQASSSEGIEQEMVFLPSDLRRRSSRARARPMRRPKGHRSQDAHKRQRRREQLQLEADERKRRRRERETTNPRASWRICCSEQSGRGCPSDEWQDQATKQTNEGNNGEKEGCQSLGPA